MVFNETKLKGSFIIEPEKNIDDRGFFTRAFCKKEFEVHGLKTNFLQSNISYNIKKKTLRGLHYQMAPFEEVKLGRCTRGAIYNIIVDLRPESVTYKHWTGVELTADNYKMLYVPEGFAHGYQALTDNSEFFYHTSEVYTPEFEGGVRWDDPHLKIKWAIEIDLELISVKDKSWPNYR